MNIEFPQKLHFLFQPARYKVLYGGRGGAKSWGIARALLIMGASRPLRVLCAREFQESIADSVHQLLKSQIEAMGLQWAYEVQKTTIIGHNGTQFVFDGLRHNIHSLKSFEGADIVWVEEANTVSKASWNVLIPTIRKEGSEIWLSFNPELETDETYVRFVKNPPTGAVVCKMSWRDNPWFPKVLQQEMMDLKAKDPDAWLNIWEGECRVVLDGAIYAKQIRKVLEDGRRTAFKYDPTKPVDTYWDLGRSDSTAIWFVQHFPFEHRILDFYQNRGYAIDHYMEVLQKRPYQYGTLFLPHDARHKTIVHPLSVESQLKDRGYRTKIVDNIGVQAGIQAARMVFDTCVFEVENTAEGWQMLTHYQYEVDEHTGQFSKNPLHNYASHAADAWRMMAVGHHYSGTQRSAKRPLTNARKPRTLLPQSQRPRGTGWMAR